MEYFTIYIILFFVISVKGYWYPVNTRVNSEHITFLNNQAQERFIPNPSSKFKLSSDILRYNPFEINSTIIDKTISNKEVSDNNQKIVLNNIITNTNLINITRPKRKIRRRLCASKTKQFNFNSSSKGRFLEVFEVVQFEHVSCTSSTGLEGTCLPEVNCNHQGGTIMGTCADGYGTCCIVLFNCDGRSNARAGWFTNPGFPTPISERLSCIFTLDKNSVNIKQIRLDFMNFELLPPIYGNCEQDQFVVTAQNTNNIIPILCGINTGQHVYIEVSNVDGPLIFSMQTVTEENRLYSIKITQLTALDTLAAPTGCLQFFKETQGHLESFNYRYRSEIGIPRSSSYMNNFNYAMCIERTPNSCSVTYTNVGEMQIVNYDTGGTAVGSKGRTYEQLYCPSGFKYDDVIAENLLFLHAFSGCDTTSAAYNMDKVKFIKILQKHPELGLPVIPPLQAGVEILNCPSDYLLMAAVRLCGERLNDGSVLQDFSLDAPVTDDSAGPIVVWFRSDGVYTGRGFKLNYQQNPCTK